MELPAYITGDVPEYQYEQDRSKQRPSGSNEHKGQQKLLLVEIDFLLRWFNDTNRDRNRKTVIVYAGAADGQHIETLYKYFEWENCEWRLYDRAQFKCWQRNPRSKPTNVHFFNQFFTHADAIQLKKEIERETWDLIFISDIRSAVPNFALHKQGATQKQIDDIRVEREILQELAEQQAWIFEIQCKLAMLKFRLPYQYSYPEHNNVTSYEYVKGDIAVQPWAPKNSTECRLIVGEEAIKNKQKQKYDCVRYEKQMAWINNVARPNGLDHVLENTIMQKLRSYLQAESQNKTVIGNPYCLMLDF